MNRDRISLAALCLIAGVGLAGCTSSKGEAAEGENCDVSTDCRFGLECVIVEGSQGACLPSPSVRARRSCNADDACRLSTEELWPAESECLGGQCRCLTEEVDCVDPAEFRSADPDDPVLEEETCRCVIRGGRGDPCITAQTCQALLSCVAGECTPGDGEAGMACNPSISNTTGDCPGRLCEVRPGNALGVCP